MATDPGNTIPTWKWKKLSTHVALVKDHSKAGSDVKKEDIGNVFEILRPSRAALRRYSGPTLLIFESCPSRSACFAGLRHRERSRLPGLDRISGNGQDYALIPPAGEIPHLGSNRIPFSNAMQFAGVHAFPACRVRLRLGRSGLRPHARSVQRAPVGGRPRRKPLHRADRQSLTSRSIGAGDGPPAFRF